MYEHQISFNTNCCKQMQYFLEEDKVAIGYSKRFRLYYIRLKGSDGVQTIHHCPWCGIKLPEILDDMYDEELSKALNIDKDDINIDTYDDPKIPSEFKTDEWWKKRGI